MGRTAGICATAAAALASAGDLLLLYVGTGGDPGPGGRLLVAGHYLGALLIPLYGLGYWHVGSVLASASDVGARWLVGLGAYAGAVGGVVHGVTALMIDVAPAARRAGDPMAVLAPQAAYLLPLWLVLLVLGLVVSALHWKLVRTGHTAYPRWFALVQPASLVVLLCVIGLSAATLSTFLVPAAPNLAHVVYFGLASYLTSAGRWH